MTHVHRGVMSAFSYSFATSPWMIHAPPLEALLSHCNDQAFDALGIACGSPPPHDHPFVEFIMGWVSVWASRSAEPDVCW